MAPAMFKNKLSETSEAKSQSLSILPTPSEEKFPKLPDSPQVTLSKELTTTNLTYSESACSSDHKTVGLLFSSSSDLTKTTQSRNLPFLSKPASHNVACFASSQSLTTDSVSNYLDDDDVPLHVEVESCRSAMALDVHSQRTDWKWADELIAVDEMFDSNLTDLLVDVTVPDLDAKVCFSNFHTFSHKVASKPS